MHITIDGFGGNPTQLGNLELVRNLLDRYPDEIGMTKISVPHVFEYSGVKPEDWGVSGFVLIAESHIAVHTFPEHRQVWVDIFSCKGFDEIPAIDKIVDAFSSNPPASTSWNAASSTPTTSPPASPSTAPSAARSRPSANAGRRLCPALMTPAGRPPWPPCAASAPRPHPQRH